MDDKRNYFPIVITAVIWSGYYVATKFSNAFGLSPFVVGIAIRFVAFILLTALMLKNGEFHKLFKVEGILWKLILIGCFGFLLDITAFLGFKTDAAVYGIVLLKCDVLFVNVLSVFFEKQKFTLFDWLYTIVMLVGVVLVMDIDLSGFNVASFGNIYFILSALFVSLNAFVIKSVQKDKKNPAGNNVVAYYNNFVTMLFFIGCSLITTQITDMNQVFGSNHMMSVLFVAGIGQTLVYIFYYKNLRSYPVWIVKIFLLLMPVFALLILFIFFNETLIMIQYIGMAIVLAGAVGIIYEQKKKTKLRSLENE